MKSFFARAALALTLAVPLLWAAPSEACGPDCSEPSPRDDLQACMAGKLGDLTEHSPECQTVGFLLMRGLAGPEKELVASMLPLESSYPGVYTGTWTDARAKVPVPSERGEIATEAPFGEYTWFFNCLTGAFEVAAQSLDERIAKLGASHPEVIDWAKAQDAVFANCGRGEKVLPAPAPANASAGARTDRAYQTAAALFYAGEFEEAIRQLDAIAKDAASPWRGWARLVAVRAVIRQATLVAQADEEKRVLLERARERCVAIVKDPGLKDLHRQTRQLTWFIDYRLRPDKQLNLLGRVLLEKPDDNFGYAWRDYFALRKGQPPSTDELSSFLDVFRGKDGYARAVEWWKKTRSQPWLVAALSQATGKEPELAELLAQSASIPKDSPAYVTVHAARGRMALAQGRFDEARAELLPLLESGATTLPPLTVKRLSEGLRQAALTFEEWAKYAHLSTSEADRFFTLGVPVARFKDAKMLAALDPKLRREVVLGGWARAALLDRWEEEKALEPLVEQVAPELKEVLAKVKAREKPEERRMAAVWVLLKSPGMSPNVSPYRTQGGFDYDICLGSGWCGGEPTDFYQDCDASKGSCGTRFISVAERREVLAERQALGKLGESPELLIQFTLDYAKRHPDDALVPEALHESVRQTRFDRTFCTSYEEGSKARSALSKQAFQLLQRKYGKTEWAKKTQYHY
ncbi:hypothetical protein [Hyalangium minutum]|uniref:Tetratricopeptide repeat protein n=1 Tax=Hyalangium minutum TaxID=394096 RepID=A0A085VXH2_9BACT|nr:hypothetical protein [Hyalangium minutum]KFE60135.1 hypothetical protein DB31_6006 [Hyalangium minutum]